MTDSEIIEVRKFIKEEMLPTNADGYTTGEVMSEIIIGTLRLQDNHLLKTTELGTIILENKDEFYSLVEEEFKKLKG